MKYTYELASQTTEAIFNALLKAGAEKKQLLELAGFSEQQLSDDSYDKHTRLWQAGEKLLNRPDIALYIGGRNSPFERGVVGGLFICSETLGDAVKVASRYLHILVDYIDIELSTDSKYFYFKFSYSREIFSHYGLEHHSKSVLNWMRTYAGKPIKPCRVQFQFQRQYSQHLYTSAFDCHVDFEQKENMLVFPLAVQGVQRTNYSQYIRDLLLSQAQQIDSFLTKNESFLDKAEKVIKVSIHQRRTSSTDIARKLNLSQRTYHRKLSNYGVTHQQLLDRVRKEIAMSYLLEPNSCIKYITYHLGYSDFSSFSRAFKRWTGDAPSNYVSKLKKLLEANNVP